MRRQTYLDDERKLALRAAKLVQFLQAPIIDQYRLSPYPWKAGSLPYHFSRPVRNLDGHGGYSRNNQFDEDGVPFQSDGSRRVYHPLEVANYAMKVLQIGADSGESDTAGRADHLLEALIASGEKTGAWGRGESSKSMSSRIPYANVQGLVISALLRLCRGKPDGKLQNLLDRAIGHLSASEADGGTVSILDGGSFLEEAPRTALKHILGGCLTSLFGLYDAVDALSHPVATRVSEEVARTAGRVIPQFISLGGWSYYALSAYGHRYLASMHYHQSTILKARIMADRTGVPSFGAAADRWEEALRSFPIRSLAATYKAAQTLWLRDVRALRMDLCP